MASRLRAQRHAVHRLPVHAENGRNGHNRVARPNFQSLAQPKQVISFPRTMQVCAHCASWDSDKLLNPQGKPVEGKLQFALIGIDLLRGSDTGQC